MSYGKMNVPEAIARAVKDRDVVLANRVVNHLRYSPNSRIGLTYKQTAALFREHGGLDLESFEELMQDCDEQDGKE